MHVYYYGGQKQNKLCAKVRQNLYIVYRLYIYIVKYIVIYYYIILKQRSCNLLILSFKARL